MYLGIDLGTSAVKALLVDEEQRVIAQGQASLSVERPRPLWSEQDPEAWWRATNDAVGAVRSAAPAAFTGLRAVGLSGQMHGATLLDAEDRVLRPAILWNDGRSAAECVELERRVPESRRITGNLAMPGFTAPKLLWVERHEPSLFSRVRTVLLPKDYVRLRLSGDKASDLSDSAGTLWLDVARRAWSEEMLGATHLARSAMPRLHEGNEATGTLLPSVAREWGVADGVVVAAGAGDNAAGAVGAGVVRAGQAFLSLGTSGVLFVASDRYAANPDGAVHTFCHCLPRAWHQMAVILSAASCLSWVTALTGARDEASLLAEAEASMPAADALIFLPYLSGERTPHNDPHAKGVFFGLTHETRRGDLARAVLEGVAYAFADGQAALLAAGVTIDETSVIGGGARSELWGKILAGVLGRPLVYRAGGEVGPAFGAARLARLAVSAEAAVSVCSAPPASRTVDPDRELVSRYAERGELYRRLYRELRDTFAKT
jgi:xylulokinase